MAHLTLRIFDVGNGDCLVLEMGQEMMGAVDFHRLDSLEDYPLHSGKKDECDSPNVVFACLTHPHSDHMADVDEIEQALEFVARCGGEFWHTVADMAEVIRLHMQPRVEDAICEELSTGHLPTLARLASQVAEKFPAERIRFVCTDPDESPQILSTSGVDIEVLGPSKADTIEYVHMLRRIDRGELKRVNNSVINRTSAVLHIHYGDNSVVLGGDAPSDVWESVMRQAGASRVRPFGVQAVKASHHGSNDAFYPELWDDLFGDSDGFVFVSANGTTRPTAKFLDSFQLRKSRGIEDKLYCTGPMDPQQRPEFLDLQYQAVLDVASRKVRGFQLISWGTIVTMIPFEGSITVSQPYTTRI